MTAVDTDTAAKHSRINGKGGPHGPPPFFAEMKFLYGCAAGISLTLCASPAASIVAPIIAGNPMQEFSMSW